MAKSTIVSTMLGCLLAAAMGLSAYAQQPSRAAKTTKQKPATAATSPYAKICAAKWPIWVQEDAELGAELGESHTPEEMEKFHRQFMAICLTQGPAGLAAAGMMDE
ncbi:MAG TPA: hypothetical protein VFA53_03425 [Xanthobacteraceae bacterium]|nr:hypothetical protein [Xanthobacteraceae bacterium]